MHTLQWFRVSQPFTLLKSFCIIVIIAWLFTEYDVARNSHVLHWNFSILRATLYSVNSQVIVFIATLLTPKYHNSTRNKMEDASGSEVCALASGARGNRFDPRDRREKSLSNHISFTCEGVTFKMRSSLEQDEMKLLYRRPVLPRPLV